jgi:hypothetical protein
MSVELRHTKFLNNFTYFRAQNHFNRDARLATSRLRANEELAAIRAKCPKDK